MLAVCDDERVDPRGRFDRSEAGLSYGQPRLDARHRSRGGKRTGGSLSRRSRLPRRRHSPRACVGGRQGLNVGVQEAVGLGRKRAQVVKGMSPPCLLDMYHFERHRVAAHLNGSSRGPPSGRSHPGFEREDFGASAAGMVRAGSRCRDGWRNGPDRGGLT